MDDSYLLISPCRNEADFMVNTLESVVSQSLMPTKWIIVDDGSTDGTSEILRQYSEQYDFIQIVTRDNRGHRSVGPGVIEAFYTGLRAVNLNDYEYLCKLDLDLDLPTTYFETLVSKMKVNPRIGTCSGKPYNQRDGRLVSEKRGDEMSVGMTKFYRRECFEAIGGYVREVMWDAIDCHKARQLGWQAVSWDDPELRFEHLRPMGSSQSSIYSGRRRHGRGQYFMGSDPLFFAASCVFRMAEPPLILGGLAMMQGYLAAWIRRMPQLDDPDLRRFIRAYQRRALVVGKARAVAEIEARQAHLVAAAQA